MSPKLKPLLLPQLVEERKRMEVQQSGQDGESTYTLYTDNASSSDLNSPVTPTFSSRHLRYSSSSSSLELMPPCSSCSDSPASPTQATHPSKPSKRQLPDVQEDPLEREEEGPAVTPEERHLYDCLCKATSFCAPPIHFLLMSRYRRRAM